MRLKRSVICFLVAATPFGLAIPAGAADITITENADELPTLTTSGVTLLATPDILPEFVALTASVPVTPGTAPLVSGAVVLTEPASDPFAPRESDIVVLEAGAPTDNAQRFNLLFASDGVREFDILIAGNPNALTLLETGDVQAVGGADLPKTEPFLTINVQSDLNDPEVPEPGAVFLLGLAAFAGFARLGRASSRHEARTHARMVSGSGHDLPPLSVFFRSVRSITGRHEVDRLIAGVGAPRRRTGTHFGRSRSANEKFLIHPRMTGSGPVREIPEGPLHGSGTGFSPSRCQLS